MPTTNFPTSLDDGTSLPNPGSSDVLDSSTTNLLHHNQHDIENDAIKALESKVGVTNSQDSTSHDARVRCLEIADWTVIPNSFSSGFTDDEFDASSLNSGLWTWLNQGTATASQLKGHLLLAVAQTNGQAIRGVYQAVPSPSTWTVEAKAGFQANGTNILQVGMFLYESATGKIIIWGKQDSDSNANGLPGFNLVLSAFTNTTTFNGGIVSFGTQPYHYYAQHPFPLYFRIRTTATQYFFDFSVTGVAWYNVISYNLNAFFTTKADKIGLFINNNGTTVDTASAIFDFIRQTA